MEFIESTRVYVHNFFQVCSLLVFTDFCFLLSTMQFQLTGMGSKATKTPLLCKMVQAYNDNASPLTLRMYDVHQVFILI